MRKFVILTLAASLLLSSCSKLNNEKRPTGKQSCSFYLNKNLYYARPPFETGGLYSPPSGLILLGGTEPFGNQTIIKIITKPEAHLQICVEKYAEGVYDIKEDGYNFTSDTPPPYPITCAELRINGKKYISKKGFGNITLEKVGTIDINAKTLTDVIGKFEFILYNVDNESDYLVISDGSFHI